ncbi:MAG: diacylglycerol kinase family protein [Clostridia bacterium]|nr:diacylglycerol kinase family protein [Clostridia bacterium]
MKKYYVLYNPQAFGGRGKEEAELLDVAYYGEALIYFDLTEIDDYARFFEEIDEKGVVVICGGDGTLQRFLNDTKNLSVKQEIYYFACGRNNDFFRDVEGRQDRPVSLTNYIKNLPTVTVRGKERNFLNGVGFGLDGYCHEEEEKIFSRGGRADRKAIANKGLFGRYRPTDATVTVDGNEFFFKKVWLAPTLNGKYYGGGMCAAPKQDRDKDGVMLMLVHGCGRLKTLFLFPKIWKGTHVKEKKYVTFLTGKTITVRFNEPRTLQIDGEILTSVREYTVKK